MGPSVLGPSPEIRRDSSQVLSDAPSFTWKERNGGRGRGLCPEKPALCCSLAGHLAPRQLHKSLPLIYNLKHAGKDSSVAWTGRLYNLKRRGMVPFCPVLLNGLREIMPRVRLKACLKDIA